ncbi:MAG: serine hydrolase [Vagococcus sp.]|uniref:serine hydrolase n=1 Tax=Vagococcus sp. TaxID=1933889 RepID=UPI002FC5B105
MNKRVMVTVLSGMGILLGSASLGVFSTYATETKTSDSTFNSSVVVEKSTSSELITESSQTQKTETKESSSEKTEKSIERISTKETLESKRYVSFKDENVKVFKTVELKEMVPLNELKEVVIETLEKTIINEKNYYFLTNSQGKELGLVEESQINLHENIYTEKTELNKYVSLKGEKTAVYKELDLGLTEANDFVLGQTFLAKEQFKHLNGKIYYSLINSKEELVGYVESENVTIAETKGGVYQSFGKYVTVTNSTSSTYSNFDEQIRQSTSKLEKETFQARGKYHHFDGSLYYSIFDKNNKWQGYIQEKDVAVADGKQGVYQNFNKHVIVKSKNYSIWQNFSWKKKYDSSKFYQRTFLVKGEYHHFNGDIYYSLYDSNGTWYGYINKNGTTSTNEEQGMYVSYGKYVTIKNSNGNSWSNFKWNKRQELKNLSGQTFLAKGIYYHVNGDDYVSIYDRNNKWYGYVNKKFVTVADGRQGGYQNLSKYVTITKSNYSLWRNFSWKELGRSQSVYHQTFLAKGKYQHFNGDTYYSLYDNKGKWYGYINATGTTVADGAQGIYQGYGKKVTVTKRNYTMWSSFSWQKRHNTSSFMNQQFTARGKYRHFNGSTYLTLYDNKGKWYGYLNEDAVSIDAEKLARVQRLLDSKYRSPNFGIYVTSLADGSVASVNGTKTFTAASTGKLPAMYYTQKMINQKQKDPNKLYQYKDAINQMPIYSYMRGGAGILQGKPYGSYYSLDTMLNWTAKYSDNQGANFLGYYGANQYEQKMRNEISQIIGRTWVSPFQVSAKENALLISAMYRQGGQVMSYMQNTVFDNQRIPKYLPVKVAHKIGDVGSYTHDIGVVYANSPYVLSVMTQNGTSYETISVLSKEIYDIMK